jgi:hypothetical protein
VINIPGQKYSEILVFYEVQSQKDLHHAKSRNEVKNVFASPISTTYTYTTGNKCK